MRTASLLALFGIVKREREALVIGASGMGTFYNCRSIVDGNGATLIAGRRDDTRAIAKLSLFPNLFNINETAVFGMPVVLNPPMCVGFILAPLASYIISYVLTAIGFCPVMYINVPWITPIILSGLLASGGNFMGAVTQLICLAAATLIYIPCVKAYEANKNREDPAVQTE